MPLMNDQLECYKVKAKIMKELFQELFHTIPREEEVVKIYIVTE